MKFREDYQRLSVEACSAMYAENHTPKNIFGHVKIVNAIAKFLAEKLAESGIEVDRMLVDKASLLHDVEKWTEISRGYPRHTFGAYNKLIMLGHPFTARVILKHELDTLLDGKYGLVKIEDIIVFYADKRALDDTIVSLDNRLAAWKKRYGTVSGQSGVDFDSYAEPLLELEQKIFKNLGIKPEDITIDAVMPYLVGDDY
jgi:hypothetical protein